MKKVLTIVLVLAMVLGLCACGGEGGKKFDKLHVGVSRQDITPDSPIGAHIEGGGDPNRMATGILDEQTITCIAITDKTGNTVLFYSQDLANAWSSIMPGYREMISKETGIPAANIYMTATHTHSSLKPQDTSTQANVDFTAKYEKAIVAAAKEALEDRAPAQMFCSEVNVQEKNNGKPLAFVRHYKLTDGSIAGSNFGNYNNGKIIGFPYEADNEAQLIKIVREGEGKDPVLMMNWPAHSTFHGTTSKRNISSDYPAYVRGYIEDNTDYTFALFLSGAGDQVPNVDLYPEANHGMECAQYGQTLGQIIADYTADDANFRAVEDDAIKQKNVVVTVDSNKIPAEMAEFASKAEDVYNFFLENGQEAGSTYAVSQGFYSPYEARSYVNRAQLEDSMDISIDVMSLGNMGFAIAGYEISGGNAVAIKEAFKEQNGYTMGFMVGYCNQNLGYIPAASNYEYNNGRGSYEAYDCKYAKGTDKVLEENFIQMLKDLKAE